MLSSDGLSIQVFQGLNISISTELYTTAAAVSSSPIAAWLKLKGCFYAFIR